MAKNKGTKLIAQNKKAYHEYYIEDIIQAGIELFGTEVKSMRLGKCSLSESFIRIVNGECVILGMHISPYENGGVFNKDAARDRRLLLHKREIVKMADSVKKDGFTIVPLRAYFAHGYIKIDIALAKGKKIFDKRDSIAKKDMQREAQRSFRVSNL